MSDQQNVDKGRRNLLVATSVAGGMGGVAVVAPFVCAFAPSEKARVTDAPVKADVSDLAPGQMKMVEWRGKPVRLLKYAPDMLESFKKTGNEVTDPKSDMPFTMKTPDYCKNKTHSRAEYKDPLVVTGICSHLDCPSSGSFPVGTNAQLAGDLGFICPCHGFTFDLAGRVFRNRPAPQNLDAPSYTFLSSTKLMISKDKEGEV